MKYLLMLMTICLILSVSQADEVIVSGAGITETEALKSAFRNAVERVIGSMISPDALVKNSVIIRDRILSNSKEFITKYDIIGKPLKEGGIIRVQIKATVSMTKLYTRLKSEKVIRVKVTDNKLFSQAISDWEKESNKENDSAKLLEKLFKNFSSDIMSVQTVGKPRVINKTNDTAQVGITVHIGIDQKKYNNRVKVIIPFLKKISIGEKKYPLSKVLGRGRDTIYNSKLFPSWFFSKEESRSSHIFKCPSVFISKELNNQNLFAILDQSKQIRVFKLKEELFAKIRKIAFKKTVVSLLLKNNQGDIIKTIRKETFKKIMESKKDTYFTQKQRAWDVYPSCFWRIRFGTLNRHRYNSRNKISRQRNVGRYYRRFYPNLWYKETNDFHTPIFLFPYVGSCRYLVDVYTNRHTYISMPSFQNELIFDISTEDLKNVSSVEAKVLSKNKTEE